VSPGRTSLAAAAVAAVVVALDQVAKALVRDGLELGERHDLIAGVFFFVTHTGRPLVWLPTGLLLGGAVGNVIDRARDGSVTDFVKFPHFPAFNVADMAITVGVLALIYVLEGRPRRRARTDGA
jgi:signal peptidase II